MAKTTGKTGGSSRKKKPLYKKLEKKPKQKARAAVRHATSVLFFEYPPAKSSRPVSKIAAKAIGPTLRYEQNKSKPDYKRIDALKKRLKSKFKSPKKKVK
jgi:hypothetical protein|tara:strand:+ start:283 stop:582 length:300 start_codon:yes stop_codon:yes gene_type:complete